MQEICYIHQRLGKLTSPTYNTSLCISAQSMRYDKFSTLMALGIFVLICKIHGLSTVEGTTHLPFMAYRLLAKLLFRERQPGARVRPHLPHPSSSFLVLDWNLVSRSEYVVNSKIDLISVENDSLLFDMGPTKTDQDGMRNVDPPLARL